MLLPCCAIANTRSVDNGLRFAYRAPEDRLGTKKETEGIGLTVFTPVAPLPCTDGILCVNSRADFESDQILSRNGHRPMRSTHCSIQRGQEQVRHVATCLSGSSGDDAGSRYQFPKAV